MKSLIVLSLALAFTAPAFAARQTPSFGSKCGLTDEYGEEFNDVKSLVLNLTKKKDVVKLTTVQKQQILVATREFLEGNPRFETAQEALDELSKWTSGDALYHQKTEVLGKIYDVVIGYPGDTPIGVVFAEDSLHIVAYIQDSDVVCD